MPVLMPGGYPLAKEFVAFIKAREQVRLNKEAGKPRPWTKDPILDTYRFCNVHREDDRVTRELKALAPADHPDLWFWWVVARLFNKPRTMKTVEEFVCAGSGFYPEQVRKRLYRLRESHTIFNAAYIVSTNGVAMDKVDYLIDRVLKPLWKDRASIRPTTTDDLLGWHGKLTMYDGLGSFIAAQVVADMKYAPPLNKAKDWWTFAASGPGSRRGLNRCMGVLPDMAWRRGAWEEALAGLAVIVAAPLAKTGITLHAQDLQNCLCEFDKYRRAVEGGAPKQLYKEEKK